MIVPVVRRGDYWIALEQWEGITAAHCSVRRWNHKIARQLRADFDDVVRLHGGPIYAVEEPRPGHRHFLHFMGFRQIGTRKALDGRDVPFYERT